MPAGGAPGRYRLYRLPVLYRYGGFGSADPLDGQKRFLNDADGFIDIVQALQAASAGDGNCSVGIAPHSLRAINRELLSEVIGSLDDLAAIHLHIAEQTKEVDDCLAWCGSARSNGSTTTLRSIRTGA